MSDGVIRPARGAGRWFPADERELRGMVEGFMGQAPPFQSHAGVVAGIAPHAGFEYSGAVAAHTFRALADSASLHGRPETVVVLGLCHRPCRPGVALLDGAGLATPLGVARLDEAATSELAACAACIFPDASQHAEEHSAENQVPFLQIALPTAKLVVALMGDHRPETVDAISAALIDLAGRRRIAVIASTDLLHDPDYKRVTETDRETMAAFATLDPDAISRRWHYTEQVCCGIGPVLATMRFARARGCSEGTVLHYCNSGDDHPESRGSWVVGYGAAVFVPSAS